MTALKGRNYAVCGFFFVKRIAWHVEAGHGQAAPDWVAKDYVRTQDNTTRPLQCKAISGRQYRVISMSIVVAAKIISDAKKQSQHKAPERIGTDPQHPHPYQNI